MRKVWLPFALAIGIALPLWLGCSQAAKADGTLLAEYKLDGKQQITLEELEQEISELPSYKQRKYEDVDGKREYLELMAESRLILAEAQKRKLDEDPEILKKVEEYLHQLMVEKITEMEVDQKVQQVTEEAMKAYYDAHMEDYVEPEQVRLTCIMSQDDEEKAKEWYAAIQAGKDIVELAKELAAKGELKGPGERSEGDTGFFDRNAFSVAPDFTKAAFELEVGQLYDGIMPIQVGDSYYYAIFRLEERKPERQKEFSEESVQKDIRRKLEKQYKQERMDAWVSEVRNRYALKLYPERIVAKEEPEESAAGSETKAEEAASSDVKGSGKKESAPAEAEKAEAQGSEKK